MTILKGTEDGILTDCGSALKRAAERTEYLALGGRVSWRARDGARQVGCNFAAATSDDAGQRLTAPVRRTTSHFNHP